MTKLSQPNKYHNVKTIVDGITFDSKAEARRYGELVLLKRAGEIRWFNLQPSFLLTGGVRYRPDFIVCGNDGRIWVEDVKGVATQAFRIKQKIWAALYPDMWLEVIK